MTMWIDSFPVPAEVREPENVARAFSSGVLLWKPFHSDNTHMLAIRTIQMRYKNGRLDHLILLVLQGKVDHLEGQLECLYHTSGLDSPLRWGQGWR